MKKILLVLLISFSLISYGKSINIKQLQDRQGLKYEVNQQIPYTGEVITDYSWNIERKETYKDGKKHGEIIYYYENKQIKAKETYKDGELIY